MRHRARVTVESIIRFISHSALNLSRNSFSVKTSPGSINCAEQRGIFGRKSENEFEAPALVARAWLLDFNTDSHIILAMDFLLIKPLSLFLLPPPRGAARNKATTAHSISFLICLGRDSTQSVVALNDIHSSLSRYNRPEQKHVFPIRTSDYK